MILPFWLAIDEFCDHPAFRPGWQPRSRPMRGRYGATLIRWKAEVPLKRLSVSEAPGRSDCRQEEYSGGNRDARSSRAMTDSLRSS
jgi:hypothetical protein